MRFRSQEASDFKPNVWTGQKTNESFTAFKMELQSWAGALHDHMLKVMELVETKEGRMTEADVRNAGMSQDTISDLKEMDQWLYQLFVACTKGEAQNCVSNTEGSGFKAWKQTVSHFDPRTGADRSAPGESEWDNANEAEDTAGFKNHDASLRTGSVFEINYAKRVDEDAKILALKSIMPETLFGEASVFRGRSFSTYAELRASIIRYLDDKVPVSMMTKSSSSSVTTSFVQNLIEGERENEEEDKDSITQEKIICHVPAVQEGQRQRQEQGQKAKESAGTLAMVITTAEIDRTTSKKATKTKVQAKDGTQEKATGTVPKAKGKSGNRMEMELNVGQVWKQVDPIRRCIMEMDDNQPCWRNACSEAGRSARVEKGSLQELSEEAETRSLYSSAQQVPDAWYIGM